MKQFIQLKKIADHGGKEKTVRRVKHGMRYTKIYASWHGLKDRCNNKNGKDYFRYGQRGITYDPKWETFEGFYEDMGSSYSENLSLDRIDNNGNYCKENCRWTNNIVQSNNRRNTKWYIYEGNKMSLAMVSRIVKIPYATLYGRIEFRGLSFEKALQNK